ncbi:hypothetical protein GCM10023322_08240 [Rugosimonospora acidiphila]|uniref:Uncharacterized protein n=1 Tax=Rugosimonospora acidiphila TaxID=556531 RepID=A0ABP9RKZ2_9ACTN
MTTTLPLLGLGLSDLCGDGRTVVGETALLLLNEPPRSGDTRVLARDPGLSMPAVSQFSLVDLAPGAALVRRFLELRPVESLDRLVETRPPAEPTDLVSLAERADLLGVPVQTRASNLPANREAKPPLAAHRVIDLDDSGTMTAPGTGDVVRVVPTRSLISRPPFADQPDEAMAIIAAKPYLSGRIAFVDHGVELGLPARLVDNAHAEALRRHGIDDVVRGLDGRFDEVFGLAGVAGEALDGYVDLLYRMERAPVGTHGLVAVEDGDDARVYLAVRDPNGVSVIDLGTSWAASLPTDPTRVSLAMLPESLTVAQRLDSLARAWVDPQRSGSRSGDRPAGVELFGWTSGDSPRAIEVIGSVADEPAGLMQKIAEAAEQIDQPVIVLGARRSGEAPQADQLMLLRERLEAFVGLNGQMPVVVTRGAEPDRPVAGSEATLVDILDLYQVSVLYQTPTPPAALGERGPGAGAGLLNLGNWWVLREPGEAGHTESADTLTPGLLARGAAPDRRPAFAVPSRSVSSFLTTPLSDLAALEASLDSIMANSSARRAEVQAAVARVPTKDAHGALVELAVLGQGEAALNVVRANGGRGDEIIEPLLNIGHPDPQAQDDNTFTEVLSQLATVAGEGLNDSVSQAILSSIAKLIAKTMTEPQLKVEIARHRDQLPREGHVRPDWVRRMNRLMRSWPAHQEILSWVAQAILECP